jgi:molybdopterin-guanine dinucleotide biosynthesis protein A
MGSDGDPVGVILAGGRGRRIGGSKATVALAGAPLISYPLAVMRSVLDDVAVVAKPDSQLPDVAGMTIWIEPAAPQHPLVGIVYALEIAAGRPVLVCAGDLPFVPASLLRALAGARSPSAARRGAKAALCAFDGDVQPLLGCYWPEAESVLQAGLDELRPLRAVAADLAPVIVEAPDAEAVFNVNAPEDLLTAAAMLDRKASARDASRR